MSVVVFGSLNVDFVTRVPAIPRPGETVQGPSYQVLPGGKGANQALAAARSGATVQMVGAVGRDPFATIALANLVAAGVDCRAVERVEAPTGAAFISVDPAGENAIAVASGANAMASRASLDAVAIRRGDVLLLQREVPDQETRAAIAWARGHGATVILNIAPADGMRIDLLDGVGHLVANEHEARVLARLLGVADVDPASMARDIASARGFVVVVTLGRTGALAAMPDRRKFRRPALPVQVVDTTGAGDAFCGAYAACIATGEGVEAALRAGVIVSGLACTGLGAQAGLPSAELLKSRLAG